MSKYRELQKILEKIRDFGHAEDCCSCAPVYECGCYDKDQSELAREALKLLDDLEIDEGPTLGELLCLDEV